MIEKIFARVAVTALQPERLGIVDLLARGDVIVDLDDSQRLSMHIGMQIHRLATTIRRP